MPSPGGQVSEMAKLDGHRRCWVRRVWHLVDLPEGYHTASRGPEPTRSAAGSVEGWPPDCRAVGRCQVDEMPHEPQRGRDPEHDHKRILGREGSQDTTDEF